MTASPPSLVFVSVVPSPYQRDVFQAIAERHPALRVYYLEAAAPDSPWPAVQFAPWEQILPGFTIDRGRWRSHVNHGLPAPGKNEFWVVNGAMTDVTAQLLFRRLGRRTRWAFWGEQPSRPSSSLRRWVQARQYAPLRRARALVAVGERAADVYRKLVPEVPVHNQPYACDLSDFIPLQRPRTANQPASEPVFLFCGQMIHRKGIDVLLEAFDRLVTDGVAMRLLLVGREAELPALLAKLPAATRERIDYAGFQAPDALPVWFSRADVFVLPSRVDGWGVVVNQALGAGLPLICSSAVGAAHDLLKSEVNGLLVPPGDVDALAAALRRLAASPELRARFSAAAHDSAEALSPARAADFWLRLAANA